MSYIKHYGVKGMRWRDHQYNGSSSYDFDYERGRSTGITPPPTRAQQNEDRANQRNMQGTQNRQQGAANYMNDPALSNGQRRRLDISRQVSRGGGFGNTRNTTQRFEYVDRHNEPSGNPMDAINSGRKNPSDPFNRRGSVSSRTKTPREKPTYNTSTPNADKHPAQQPWNQRSKPGQVGSDRISLRNDSYRAEAAREASLRSQANVAHLATRDAARREAEARREHEQQIHRNMFDMHVQDVQSRMPFSRSRNSEAQGPTRRRVSDSTLGSVSKLPGQSGGKPIPSNPLNRTSNSRSSLSRMRSDYAQGMRERSRGGVNTSGKNPNKPNNEAPVRERTPRAPEPVTRQYGRNSVTIQPAVVGGSQNDANNNRRRRKPTSR